MIEYTLIKSKRKTIAVQITSDAEVIVRAPLRCTRREADTIVMVNEGKIRKALEEKRRRKEQKDKSAGAVLTDEEREALARAAADDLPMRVRRYAPFINASYGRITIRLQKTRWGSCSKAGNLNFNCLLMYAPERVRDYVVIHELCHLLELNHSPRFWAQVEKLMPDWKEQRRWLREHGDELMYKVFR